MGSKEYIGDSVYADIENGMIKLTTENGFGASNTIYLEENVLMSLTDYVQRQIELRLKERGIPIPSLLSDAKDKLEDA
jgi:hypothetical protein